MKAFVHGRITAPGPPVNEQQVVGAPPEDTEEEIGKLTGNKKRWKNDQQRGQVS